MKESSNLRVDKVKKSWKRTCATSNLRPYPVSTLNSAQSSGTKKFRGHFNGSNVVIYKYSHMVTLYSLGFFGKGSLSRSAPVYKRSKELAQQFENVSMEVQISQSFDSRATHDKCNEGDISASCSQRDASSLVDCNEPKRHSTGNHYQEHSSLPQSKDSITSVDSIEEQDEPAVGSSCELSINRIDVPVISEISESAPVSSTFLQKENVDEETKDSQIECLELPTSEIVSKELQIPVEETLHLNLEEAYFLAYGLGCLQIMDLFGRELTLLESWSLFCQSQEDFIQKYVVYHYFRAKGWVVKPGLKFGGHFLLYKHGPPMTHATYLVIIEVMNHKGELSEDHNPPMSWITYMSHNRVAEHAGKDVLLCRVLWPKDLDLNEVQSPNVLKQFSVQEILFSRWVSSEERERLDQDD